MDSKEFGEALAAFTARTNKAVAALNADLVNVIDKIDEAIDKAADAFRRNYMIFNEEDKTVYEPSNDLIYKRDAILAIAVYEMYGAQMDNPGTASDDIEDWKELGEMILHDVHSVEPMPNYIDNTLVARHYCNGMVAMNEECYQRLQTVKEPKRGEWKHLGGDEWLCPNCGHVVWTEGSWEHPLERGKDYCEHCGADMRKKETEHEERPELHE